MEARQSGIFTRDLPNLVELVPVYMARRRKPQVNQDGNNVQIWRICCMIEGKSLAARLTRSRVREGGGRGGIMRLWKHEGKEKKVAQEDGSKGYAYRLTPQRL